MPELGPMMRAIELQRLIEDKVTEWRERSARVAGATVAESYQQPLNFKRHTHRRKNSAEINRIKAKYSKPYKRTDEPYCPRVSYDEPPKRPPRNKKQSPYLKVLSKSEDNLATIGDMEIHPDPTDTAKPHFTISKYNTKSCEDVAAFVNVHQNIKSKNFEQHSILNAKVISEQSRPKLRSISENVQEIPDLDDSGIEFRIKSNFDTSTPVTKRQSCVSEGNALDYGFQKCSSYSNGVSDLRKGNSEPDILSVDSKELDRTKTIDWRKRWKQLKPPFTKGAFDCLLRWRPKRPKETASASRRWVDEHLSNCV